MRAPLRTSVPRSGRRVAMLVPLLFVVAACSAGARAAGPTASAADGTATSGVPSIGVGAPAQLPDIAPTGSDGSTGSGVGASGTATTGAGVATTDPTIAYPFPVYPGSSGVAPDHTIVVVGVGEATVKADLSDRASAQRKAIAAALTDARAQADEVAGATGLTITGVLSVSVSSGQGYVLPMAAAEGSAPGSTPGGTTITPPVPVPPTPTTSQLSVSVTVAYQVD
jgi:hypothetical protein